MRTLESMRPSDLAAPGDHIMKADNGRQAIAHAGKHAARHSGSTAWETNEGT